MASTMSSYSIAISGMRASQYGLSTVSHNVSNTDTPGYTRQHVVQTTFQSVSLKETALGKQKYGLGTDIATIRQIRNKFYDNDYREQASNANYYSVRYVTGNEIESVLGELESSYKGSQVLTDMYEALNELSIDVEGIDTRGTFIEACYSFINKVKDMDNSLYDYQQNLNGQVKTVVSRINEIVEDVSKLNGEIFSYEANGDTANDLRDKRNNLLDELSTLADIKVKENPITGMSEILINGKELLTNNDVTKLGLRYVDGETGFVEPVFTTQTEILACSQEARSVYGDISKINLDPELGNGKGQLLGILSSRGDTVANYTTDSEDIKNQLIPNIQKKFDTLVHGVVTFLNDTFASGNSYDLEGNNGVPIFTLENENGLYTTKNIVVNPELMKADGYNKLALSATGHIGDQSLVVEALDKWQQGVEQLGGSSVTSFYNSLVTDFAIEVEEYQTYYDEQNNLLTATDNKRMVLSGVSLEEELTNMMKYQHAYNASAKVLNVIDSMIDKIVNNMV